MSDKSFDEYIKDTLKNQIDYVPEDVNDVFDRTFEIIRDDTKNVIRKKQVKKKKIISAACIILCLISVSQTVYSKEIIENIIARIKIGYITIVSVSDEEGFREEIPEGAKGNVFDKDGQQVEYITDENYDKLYDKDGELIDSIEDDGTIVTASQAENEEDEYLENLTVVNDESEFEADKDIGCSLPQYIPDGFRFEKAEIDKAGEQIFVDYSTNDEQKIYITIYGMDYDMDTMCGGSNIEEININGNKAIASDEFVMVKKDNYIYAITTKVTGLSKEEAIKIAESIK